VAARRFWWKAYQGRLDPTRLVFLDETWVKTNMAPLRGWCRKGDRLKAWAPHGHWKTMTFLAALKHDGIAAPCVFDGPINGERFTAWVKQMLCPTLRHGDIVIMDNLSSHKSIAVRDAIRAKGARLLFLPPYSPDLNPIEQSFSKIKHWMRMKQARSVDSVHNALADIIDTISPQECQNYFRNSGYDHC
jgi:transposase